MKYVKNLIQIIGIIQISIGSTCLNLASATSVSGKEFSEQLTQFNVKLIGKQVCNEKNLRSSNENSFDYKLDQGFSAGEIINKSRSLKGIMEPFSTNGNIQLLKRAGFKDIVTIFKFTSFEGILAIK